MQLACSRLVSSAGEEGIRVDAQAAAYSNIQYRAGGREQRTKILASSPLHDRVATNKLCSRRFQILSLVDVERFPDRGLWSVSEVPCLMSEVPCLMSELPCLMSEIPCLMSKFP